MAKKVRIGEVVKVENQYKKRFANTHYYSVIVKIDEAETPLMFTEDALIEAYDRAMRNSEDRLDRSFISYILD